MDCSYCGRSAVLLRWEDAGYPYSEDWGPAWKCAPCDAYIRCYAGTTRPLGTLADARTREWRGKAHAAIDPFWEAGGMSRSAVYRWLSVVLEVPKAHIGLLDVEGCQRVIEAAETRPPVAR